jgi:purine nucleosidase
VIAGLLALAAATTAPAPAARPVAIDNDWSIAGGAMAVMPLIADRSVRVVGLTGVIGDSYVPDSTAHTLRFLEIVHRPDIPLVEGANTPLVRTAAELGAWEAQYGALPYKGAWNPPKPGEPAIGPNDLSPMKEGPTRLRPAPGVAAQWLIDQAKRYPGQLEILAAGPLTNLALAVRLDPNFAKRVKTLVIMGGMTDNQGAQVAKDANFYTDFNFLFDPEAADIVLTAGFANVVIAGTVTNGTMLTKAMVDRIAATKTPLTAYYARNAWVGLPLWDELAAAILADPTLVAKSTDAWARVDLSHGAFYGSLRLWPDKGRPHRGEGRVTIVDAVDLDRFYAGFEKALTAPLP